MANADPTYEGKQSEEIVNRSCKQFFFYPGCSEVIDSNVVEFSFKIILITTFEFIADFT